MKGINYGPSPLYRALLVETAGTQFSRGGQSLNVWLWGESFSGAGTVGMVAWETACSGGTIYSEQFVQVLWVQQYFLL